MEKDIDFKIDEILKDFNQEELTNKQARELLVTLFEEQSEPKQIQALTDEEIKKYANTFVTPEARGGIEIGAKWARDWMQEHQAVDLKVELIKFLKWYDEDENQKNQNEFWQTFEQTVTIYLSQTKDNKKG